MVFKDIRNCKFCGNQFVALTPVKRYCSSECQKTIMKEKMAKYNREIKDMRIKNRRCVKCDKDLEDDEQTLNCKSCRDEINKYYKDLRDRKLEGTSGMRIKVGKEKIIELRKERAYRIDEDYKRNIVFAEDTKLKSIPRLNEGYLYRLNGKIARLVEDRLVVLTELELVGLIESFIDKTGGSKNEEN